jgi:hypothetical protein
MTLHFWRDELNLDQKSGVETVRIVNSEQDEALTDKLTS